MGRLVHPDTEISRVSSVSIEDNIPVAVLLQVNENKNKNTTNSMIKLTSNRHPRLAKVLAELDG